MEGLKLYSKLSDEVDGPCAQPASGQSSILFLVSHSSAGGAQEIWANIAEGFRVRGHPVTLMALYPYREVVRETSPQLPWAYVAKTRPKSPIAQIRMFCSLVAILKRQRPAVVFTALPAANVLAAVAARLAGPHVKVVTSHHSPVQTYNALLNIADSLTGCLSSVQTIVSVSDTVKASQDAKPGPYRDKRRTIHNALPPPVEAQLASLAQGRDRSQAQGRKVVATGRLAWQKNYPVLIRAAQHMPDVRIEIVGDGPDEAALKALAAELGVQDRVDFVGFQPRQDTLSRLAQGDIFIQPSLFEGHSLALVEAAKLGLPLVVSEVPVQIEGITDSDGQRCGIAIEPQDDVGFARALTHLLDDPQAYRDHAERSARLGRGATFEVMIKAYEDLAP